MIVGRDQEALRRSAVDCADRWVVGQAARLQTGPAVVLDAVRRGWLPPDIETATSKYQLEDIPPPDAAMREAVAAIRSAPIRPVINTRSTRGGDRNSSWRHEQSEPDGPTAMEQAFQQAAG
jgi:hypothetical protein